MLVGSRKEILLSFFKCYFGKIGRSASEEVVLQLVSSKCLPILLYGLEACFLTLSDIRSLDFAVNRFLMKLFKTVNMEIIQDCRDYFNFRLPSVLIVERRKTFMLNYANCNNSLCELFHDWYVAWLVENFIFIFLLLVCYKLPILVK
jgi:hypothetical protein